MGRLQNKVAVVTGASKGIGAGIARALAKEGAALVLNYASGKDGAEKLAAEIVASGGRAVALQADTSKPGDIKRLFAETAKAFGRLDILVNNAGVFKFAPLEESEAGEFHRQFDINVLGPILASREAANLFGPEGGSIINVSSVASTKGMPGSVIYAGTKGALDAVTRVLANELGPRKIRVNTVAPGMVETEGTHTAAEAGTIASGPDNGYNGEYAGFTRLTSGNAGTATIRGWEFTFQQQFTFLPGLLKGLGASANYTLIKTEGDFGGATNRSTNEVPGFIPRTGNASLSWRHGKFSTRVLYNFVGSYITAFTAATPARNNYRYKYETVTAGVAYQYRPWLQFTVDVANLFNEPQALYRSVPSQMSTTIINGTSITFGVNGRF